VNQSCYIAVSRGTSATIESSVVGNILNTVMNFYCDVLREP
jgi:hypothetical protein